MLLLVWGGGPWFVCVFGAQCLCSCVMVRGVVFVVPLVVLLVCLCSCGWPVCPRCVCGFLGVWWSWMGLRRSCSPPFLAGVCCWW